MDSDVLVFTRDFYLALAIGRTVKDYFEICLQVVAVSLSVSRPQEEMKFLFLLTVKGNHYGRVFYSETVSDWSKMLVICPCKKQAKKTFFYNF